LRNQRAFFFEPILLEIPDRNQAQKKALAKRAFLFLGRPRKEAGFENVRN
jgi:hypothetical protein